MLLSPPITADCEMPDLTLCAGLQFNYMDGDDFVFMDMESFDTENVPAKVIGDSSKWIKEVCLEYPPRPFQSGLK